MTKLESYYRNYDSETQSIGKESDCIDMAQKEPDHSSNSPDVSNNGEAFEASSFELSGLADEHSGDGATPDVGFTKGSDDAPGAKIDSENGMYILMSDVHLYFLYNLGYKLKYTIFIDLLSTIGYVQTLQTGRFKN